MKLQYFSIERYRSIVKARKIEFHSYNVLLGKNNEGKTNILTALNSAFELLRLASRLLPEASEKRRIFSSARTIEKHYSWTRDFPVSLQDKNVRKKESIFTISVDLSEVELQKLRDILDSQLSSEIVIEISVGPECKPIFKLIKRGPQSARLQKDIGKIADFISENMFLQYIPAVRTEDSSRNYIDFLVSDALQKLEENEHYKAAIEEINAIQLPEVEKIGSSLTEALKKFLPSVRAVRIEALPERIYRARRGFLIQIDDGNLTNLESKGDGVKSIVALALSRYGSEQGRSALLLIEEPEAHLHPGASHDLRKIFDEISVNQQIIISTHNSAFVNRENPRSNVVVDGGKANPAKSLREVRNILGIKVSDNLEHADFVIVVEGSTDCDVVGQLLRSRSKRLAGDLKEGQIAIQEVGGASNLSYKLSMLREASYRTFVLFDGDKPGRQSVLQSQGKGELKASDYALFQLWDDSESEIEDIVRPEVYNESLEREFGIIFSRHNPHKKWSDNISEILRNSGKIGSKDEINAAKKIVASSVVKSSKDPFIVSERLNSILQGVERRFLGDDSAGTVV